MNIVKRYVVASVVVVIVSSSSHAKKWIVDTIVARVNNQGIILKSDLEKPLLNSESGVATLPELINEEILYQRGKIRGMVATDADIDRQMNAFKASAKLTDASDAEVDAFLRQNGFSLNHYRKMVGRTITTSHIRSYELGEKIFVTAQEVEAYYKSHPESTPEMLHLQVMTLSQDELDNYQKIVTLADRTWTDLGLLPADEIDERFYAAKSLKVGAMTKPIESEGKYFVLQLKERQKSRLKTLSERYADIETTIKIGKQENLLQNFEQDLRAKTHIHYFYE